MIAIKSMSSKGANKECLMHSKSDNIKIITNDKVDEDIEEIFQSFLLRYQVG